MSKTILLAGAALLATAVAIGAFGAHGLKPILTEEMMQVYKTGVEYHFYHALGLLLLGVISLSLPLKLLNWSALFLGIGILCISFVVLFFWHDVGKGLIPYLKLYLVVLFCTGIV